MQAVLRYLDFVLVDWFAVRADSECGVVRGSRATFLQHKQRENMMKKIPMAVLFSMFVAVPAVAADMYVGINVGSAKIDASNVDSTTSFALLGGYTFNEYFAAELAYTDFGSKDYSTFSLKSSAWSISGVGSYPFNEQFSVFGKLGIATTSTDTSGYSTSKSDLTYGIGGQYNVNKQVGIRLGYDVYKIADPTSASFDEAVTSIGGVFKF